MVKGLKRKGKKEGKKDWRSQGKIRGCQIRPSVGVIF